MGALEETPEVRVETLCVGEDVVKGAVAALKGYVVLLFSCPRYVLVPYITRVLVNPVLQVPHNLVVFLVSVYLFLPVSSSWSGWLALANGSKFVQELIRTKSPRTTSSSWRTFRKKETFIET